VNETETEIETTGSNGEKRRFRVCVDGLLLNRVEYLLPRQELGLPDTVEGFVIASLYSFTTYQERRLRELRGEGRR